MNCPHCGGAFSGYRKERDALALELGRCVDCGADKTEEEISQGRWRCRRCRERRANHAAAKRGVKNEYAVRHIYAK